MCVLAHGRHRWLVPGRHSGRRCFADQMADDDYLVISAAPPAYSSAFDDES
jgi:hypothetical protein